ncbi:MAG: DNA polymerase III subunit delta [Lonepinella koalarum]|nr:DNA polymerase III subunit delta [Lonepinella koalarum]
MQRIFPEGLDLALEKGLKPFYLLSGQDPLLINEVKTKISRSTKAHGFDEKTEVHINNETNWDELFDLTQSNGLFFSRQILILNLPETPTVAQQKSLVELLGYAHSDLLFIFYAPKLTKALEKQGWFAHISENGILINCQTPDLQKLPNWVSQRARTMALELESEVIQFLCYNYEGNLLALNQALQLLQLQLSGGKITLSQAKSVIEQSAQFTPFQWIDALLEGKVTRAIRILHNLRNEDIQPVLLLRLVQKELMLLLEITRSPHQTLSSQVLFTGNLRSEFDRLKVWQNRRGLYHNLVQKMTYRKLYRLIQGLSEMEKQVKQSFSDDIWAELERFSAQFH